MSSLVKKPVWIENSRDSNLELYRIVCMLLIVMHHYVVNSGLAELAFTTPLASKSVFLFLFGAWGKTGINCFVLITGYFMCESHITLRKFLKLLLEIIFYNIVIYTIFVISGYVPLSMMGIAHALWPIWTIGSGFVSCYLVFYLAIPFLNILVHNLSKRQHLLLIALSLGIYTVLDTLPVIQVRMNYVSWFCVLFFIASYIRLYSRPVFERKSLWGWVTLCVFVLACASILIRLYISFWPYYMLSDSNRFFAVALAFCSFLWFKNMKIKHGNLINTIAASAFGVLLIHANSDMMRQWLWKDTLNNVGHYTDTLPSLMLHAFGCCIAIFLICILIDSIRIRCIERPFFRLLDKCLTNKIKCYV